MDHTNYTVETMISAKSIAARCEELAEDISLYFKDTDKLIVVGLLRGSFVFIADLARELNYHVKLISLRLHLTETQLKARVK